MLCRTAMLPLKPLTEMSHPYKKGRIVQRPLPGRLVWYQGSSLQLRRTCFQWQQSAQHGPGMHLLIGFSLLLLLFSVLDLGLIFVIFKLSKWTVSASR